MKVMAARAAAECAVPEGAFKRVAMAYWRDAADKERGELNDLLALFELTAGEANGP